MELSKIILGAGAFNTQYNKDPALSDTAEVLQYAFDNGITTIDTAAAYGPSELIVGEALQKLNVKRENYMICTKCCRLETNEFIYSKEVVLNCFNRSLDRLKTDYIDVLYVHDVEFGDPENVLEAISTAFALKDEGKVRRVGISGLPLPVLVATSVLVKQRLNRPLDIVLSYCNLTLQNELLLEFKAKLEAAGIETIVNASPLSMSLLRSRPTHSFHPAPEGLRQRADEIGEWLNSRGIELADVAAQFAFANWGGSTVIGLRSIEEVNAALLNYKISIESPEKGLWKEVQEKFGEWHNHLWEEEGPKRYQKQWSAVIDA